MFVHVITQDMWNTTLSQRVCIAVNTFWFISHGHTFLLLVLLINDPEFKKTRSLFSKFPTKYNITSTFS